MAMASAPACAASELVARGRDSAAVLQALLGQQPTVGGASATPNSLRDLAEQIIRCCDRALVALQGGRKRKPEHGGPAAAASSKRMRVSGGEKGKQVEKKGTMEDDLIWRKYGQKDIHGSKYPRLYFRCTYKDDRGCMAKRQVQQSDADASVYIITYFGEHICCRDAAAEPPPPFVINFGPRTSDGQPSGSPWPSCDDDDGRVVSETSEVCGLPEGKEVLRAETGSVAAELIEQSTPKPELTGLSSPGSEPFDGSLDRELSEISFDIGEFINFDHLAGLLQ